MLEIGVSSGSLLFKGLFYTLPKGFQCIVVLPLKAQEFSRFPILGGRFPLFARILELEKKG